MNVRMIDNVRFERLILYLRKEKDIFKMIITILTLIAL